MKIVGDAVTQDQVVLLGKEDAVLFGYNDSLITMMPLSSDIRSFRNVQHLHIHISNTIWSKFTGILREYCLPWRWQAVYLDRENGKPPEQILVCTAYKLSDRIKLLLGKSLFIAKLIAEDRYCEDKGWEFLQIRVQNVENQPIENIIHHPLGEWAEKRVIAYVDPNHSYNLYHIHRIRGIFSSFTYSLLKHFSKSWEEITLKAGGIFEKVLIKKADKNAIIQAGLSSEG